MERLPRDPVTFREIVEADLRRAARLLIKIQDEIDPQVRIATPEGDYWIALTLPPGDGERRALLERLGLFMAWKRAAGFTFASELVAPDAVYCAGIAATDQLACLARITRVPRPWTAKSFGPVEWLADGSIDPLIAALLPRRPRAMTPREIAGLEAWFGATGEFPAVHVPSGEVRGI